MARFLWPAVLAVLVVVGAVLVVPLTAPPGDAWRPVHGVGPEDEPTPEALEVPPAQGRLVHADAWFDGEAVVVFVAPEAMAPADALVHPQDQRHRVWAVAAQSTWHGCRVAVNDFDGRWDPPRLMDPCRQNQWALDGTMISQNLPSYVTDLARLRVRLEEQGGHHLLEAVGFDGPVGPQAPGFIDED